MKTPTGGDRSTQWVIQYRTPAVAENAVVVWKRYQVDPEFVVSRPRMQGILTTLRGDRPDLEWRAVRIETVQRVEDW